MTEERQLIPEDIEKLRAEGLIFQAPDGKIVEVVSWSQMFGELYYVTGMAFGRNYTGTLFLWESPIRNPRPLTEDARQLMEKLGCKYNTFGAFWT